MQVSSLYSLVYDLQFALNADDETYIFRKNVTIVTFPTLGRYIDA